MDARAQHPLPAIDLKSKPPFAVGRIHVFPLSHEVVVGEAREKLQPQPMKVLVALAARPGEVLSRDELIDLCWDGRIVGEDVINRAILLLRGVSGRLGGFEIEKAGGTVELK